MKRIHCLAILSIWLMVPGCSSEEDNCEKTITIEQRYYVNGQSYPYNTTLEVPCDFPPPEEIQEIEPPTPDNFTYEILRFDFNPDTGYNTTRLQMEIELKNGSNEDISGIVIFKVENGGLIISGPLFSEGASESCTEIAANSSCIFTYDMEESLDYGMTESPEILSIDYYLTE